MVFLLLVKEVIKSSNSMLFVKSLSVAKIASQLSRLLLSVDGRQFFNLFVTENYLSNLIEYIPGLSCPRSQSLPISKLLGEFRDQWQVFFLLFFLYQVMITFKQGKHINFLILYQKLWMWPYYSLQPYQEIHVCCDGYWILLLLYYAGTLGPVCPPIMQQSCRKMQVIFSPKHEHVPQAKVYKPMILSSLIFKTLEKTVVLGPQV